MIRKRTILSIFVVIMLISISGSQAMIDLTGTQQGSGGSSFSGKYTDLDFSGTTGLSDGVDNDSGGGSVYDQDLNTTDSPTFDGETLTGDLDMSTNDINNINNINVDNDIILNDRLEHTGDDDTYMDFNNNEILWYAGGNLLITLQQGGITFNENVTFSENITGNGSGLTIDWNNLFNVPAGFADGIDNTGGSSFNQSLNTTDDVTFNSVNASDWSDVSITESQITDLDHYTDSDIDGTETAFDNWDKNATDDMNSTGSPSNGQVAVFVDANTIEGDDNFKWDSGSSILTISELTGGTAQIILDVSAIGDGGEGYLSFRDGGDIVGVNRIGTTELEISAYSNHNRDLFLNTGNHNGGNTNDVVIETGATTGGNSGNITLTPGTASGSRGDIRLGTLTTNGFVTTNNGDGTLGVNTTISWDELSDVPVGFDDGTDDVGVYYVDNSTLNLSGYVFSINTSIFGENLTWDGNYLNATDTGFTNESEISLNYLMYADSENKYNDDDINSIIYNLSMTQDDLWSPGWISGGTITNNYDGTVDILGGTGYAIQDGHIRKINWTTVTSFGGFTNQTVNYIYVNADETVYKTFNPGNTSDVFLGAVYNMSGSCYVWNLPVRGTDVDYWQSAYSSRGIGALVQEGCGISVNGTLMPTIESGTVYTVTDRYPISEHTQFYRYYTTDDNVSWTMESYNKSVDVNRWDSPTGLASLGDDWKKDLICIDYSNDVCYYIYGQKTYENESDAREGVIPTIPNILDSVSVYSCTFIVNSSVISINDYAVDVRPYFARLFGVAPPAVSEATASVDWADILNRPSGLDDGDDNTQLSEATVDSYADNNNYFDKDTDNIQDTTNGTWGYIFTSSNRSLLQTIFGWGNHALANYLDLDTYPNADTDSTDDFSGSWNDLTDVPADFSDGIDDIDTNWNNLTNVPSGFADGIDNDTIDTNWNNLTNVPSGFADGIDNESGMVLDYLVGSNYTTVNDWWNATQSAGLLSGGILSDNGNGSVSVSGGDGIIKTVDSDTGSNAFFTFSTDNYVPLTENATNWVYIDYNGGSPIINTTSSVFNVDFHTQIIIARAYRNGTTVHHIDIGQHWEDYMRKTCFKDFELWGFQRASGLLLEDIGNRYITMTSGVTYCSHNRMTTSAINTSDGDTFTYWYRDGGGGWNSIEGSTQIDNQHYDDGDGTLGTLNPNRYGTHFVYLTLDGGLNVLYGRGNYVSLSDAEDEKVPSDVPDLIADFSILIGKIIIEESATSFESELSAFEQQFSYTPVTDHSDLSGLSDDDHTQYLLLAGRGGQTISDSVTISNNLTVSQDVECQNVTVNDTMDMSNGGTTWNMYVNATGVLVWEME